jgi:hypothetical protein
MKMWTFVLPAAAYARETIVKFDMVSKKTRKLFSILEFFRYVGNF